MKKGTQQFWLYGMHAVKAALANPLRLKSRLLLTSEAANSLGKLPSFAELASGREIEKHLPPQTPHQGVAMLVNPLDSRDISEIEALARNKEPAVVIILDQITDPHNVGAILRSAAAFGVVAIIQTDKNSAPETGALAKAASGALEVVPLIKVVNLARAMQSLKDMGFWCIGLAMKAEKTLAQLNMQGRIGLVLGAEGEGMRRLTQENCDIIAKLPMPGQMESLNVSNAAAIALYELNRS